MGPWARGLGPGAGPQVGARWVPSPSVSREPLKKQHPQKTTLWENFDKEKIMMDFYDAMKNYVLVKTE